MNLRKLFSQGCLVAFLFTIVPLPTEAQTARFGFDVSVDHKNRTAIEFLHEKGVIQGYPDGSFQPEKTVNRAELLKIFIEGQGLSPDPEIFKNCFPDVAQDWFAPYVCYAKDAGWVEGYSDGTFKPAQTVNKVESLKMLVESQGLTSELETDVTEPLYEDTNEIEWYAKYVYFAKKKGLLEETGTTFSPADDMQRGGVSENLYRFIRVREERLQSFPDISYTPVRKEVILPPDDSRGTLHVRLSPDNPRPFAVPKGALFGVLKIDFQTTDKPFEIGGLTFQSVSTQASEVLSSLYVYHGPRRISIARMVQPDGVVEFPNLRLYIPPHSTQTLTLKAVVSDLAQDGSAIAFELRGVQDMRGSSKMITFPRQPLSSGNFTVATTSTGTIFVSNGGKNELDPVIPGKRHQKIAHFQLSLDGEKEALLDRVSLHLGGGIDPRRDLSNYVLSLAGKSETVISRAPIAEDPFDLISFFLTNPITLTKNIPLTFEVYADIGRFADSSDLITTYLVDERDISARIPNYPYEIDVDATSYDSDVDGNSVRVYTPNTLPDSEVMVNFLGPVTGDINVGKNDVSLFDFMIAPEKDIEVRQLRFDLASSGPEGLKSDLDGYYDSYFRDIKIVDTLTGAVFLQPVELDPSGDDRDQTLKFTGTGNSVLIRSGEAKRLSLVTDISLNNGLNGEYVYATLLSPSSYDSFFDPVSKNYLTHVSPAGGIIGNVMRLLASEPAVGINLEGPDSQKISAPSTTAVLLEFSIFPHVDVEVRDLDFRITVDSTSDEGGLIRKSDSSANFSYLRLYNSDSKTYASSPISLDVRGNDASQTFSLTHPLYLEATEVNRFQVLATIADNAAMDKVKVRVDIEPLSDTAMIDRVSRQYISDYLGSENGLKGVDLTLQYSTGDSPSPEKGSVSFASSGPQAQEFPIGISSASIFKFTMTPTVDIEAFVFDLGLEVVGGDSADDAEDILNHASSPVTSNFPKIRIVDSATQKVMAESELSNFTCGSSGCDVLYTIGFSVSSDLWKASAQETKTYDVQVDISNNKAIVGQQFYTIFTPKKVFNASTDEAITDFVPSTPLKGSAMTIVSTEPEKEPKLEVSLSSDTPTDQQVERDQQGVKLLSFDLSYVDGTQPLEIDEIVINASDSQINQDFVAFFLNGTVKGEFSGNTIKFTGPILTLQPGQKQQVILSADFSASASPGRQYAFTLSNIFADEIAVSGLPFSGNLTTIVTKVSGILSQNTIWTKPESPYVVTGDILVNQGVRLTIDPGVQIRFDGSYYIRVDGELIAIGTSAENIIFTSNKKAPKSGDWKNVFFKDSSVDAVWTAGGSDADRDYVSGSIIQYADISYGALPIIADSASPFIANNFIHDNAGGTPPRDWPTGCIWLYNSSSVVQYNTIENNTTSAITIPYGGSVTILGNSIKNNVNGWGGGIGLFSGDNLVAYNVIEKNTAKEFGGGIAIYGGTHKIYRNVIRYNTNNNADYPRENAKSGSAIAVFSGTNLTVSENDIMDNVGPVAIFFSWSSSSVKVNDNNIVNPQASHEVYVNSAVKDSVELDFKNNYWGYTQLTDVEKRIWHYNDSFDIGHVLFDPIKTSYAPYNP